jgi:hypothetical protein
LTTSLILLKGMKIMKTYNIGERGHLISFAHPLRVKRGDRMIQGRWLFIFYEGDTQISVNLDRDLYDWTNYWYYTPDMIDGWAPLPLSLYYEMPNIIEVARKHL